MASDRLASHLAQLQLKSALLHVGSVLYGKNPNPPYFDLYAFAQSLRALIVTDAFVCHATPDNNLILSHDSSYFI